MLTKFWLGEKWYEFEFLNNFAFNYHKSCPPRWAPIVRAPSAHTLPPRMTVELPAFNTSSAFGFCDNEKREKGKYLLNLEI